MPNINAKNSEIKLLIAKKIKYYRQKNNLTLEELGKKCNLAPSQISMLESAKREAKIATLHKIAEALNISFQQLVDDTSPNKRLSLELEIEKLSKISSIQSAGINKLPKLAKLDDITLKTIHSLIMEIIRRENLSSSTPEAAKKANTDIRKKMRAQNNYIAEIEKTATDLLKKSEHRINHIGALTHRSVAVMAEQLGFKLIYVKDLPNSTRSVTDLKNGIIYLPPASIPGGHGLRSLALQAIAHIVLGHSKPKSYAEFLQQRLEINYFAAACLMPEKPAVEFLTDAKNKKTLAVEDFRDAFGVTHETAANRLSNLLSSKLDIQVHFLRVNHDGAIFRAYENDDMPIPSDAYGSVEGQMVCRKWAARVAFNQKNQSSEFYQYTDTPSGTYWSSVQTAHGTNEKYSIEVGTKFSDAKWFRGRETNNRRKSTCPNISCCKESNITLKENWGGNAWPSAKMHNHILAPLPQGTFPGVDDVELFEFLEKHQTKNY